MNRDEALKLVQEKIKNLVKHCLAVEVCMRALARHFDKDEEKWGLTGLLHDIDYEETKDNPQKHSLVGAEMLEKLNVDKEIVEAVKTHNEIHGITPETKMAKALFSVDPLTGLIVAATLVLPSKKIAELTIDNVLNRFKEKGFARGANREIISKCSDIDLSLEEFVGICLKAMQGFSEELGL
jgi:putative nucleotidyltransferase with HDIG domain